MQGHGTVSADFGSASAAEGARHELLGIGIAEGRIRLVATAQTDPLAGEYPGQPYANQPGQAQTPPSDAARSHPTCRIEVAADSAAEAREVGAVLEKRGGRVLYPGAD